MTELSGPTLPAKSGNTKSAVLILHGYGADGNDLIGLGNFWQNELPDTVFISPHAPWPCEGAPFGKQWFALFDMVKSMETGGLVYLPPEKIFEGLQRAAGLIDTAMDQMLAAYKLPANKFAIAGFSQGAMLALHVGLRRKEQLAGILGYSGLLAAPHTLPAEIKSKPPVLLIHGVVYRLLAGSTVDAR
jgi:phospholipase/carboxylesterase